jgi:hypothetical protein
VRDLRAQGLPADRVLFAYLVKLGRKVLAALGCTVGRKLYWSVMRVAPGAAEQALHYDDWARPGYTTVLIPVTTHPGQGTTYFPKRRPPTFSGTAYAFGGRVLHRGQANQCKRERIALMAVVTGWGEDEPNRGTDVLAPFLAV